MDKQNVHNITIQQSVCDSIKNLMTDPEPEFDIQMIIDSDLSEHTKNRLIEYCEDETVHSFHSLTYSDLLSYVWARIDSSKDKEELLKVLEEQIQDSECQCFTGRFNRTLSTLIGFYEDIKIEISDNDRIGAVVLSLRERYANKSPMKQKEIVKRQLMELDYDLDIIEPWIDAFDEL